MRRIDKTTYAVFTDNHVCNGTGDWYGNQYRRKELGVFKHSRPDFYHAKIVGTIHWSWWWVLAPLWGPVALFLSFVGLLLLAALFVALVEGGPSSNRRSVLGQIKRRFYIRHNKN
jgi:hypothetical protein